MSANKIARIGREQIESNAELLRVNRAARFRKRSQLMTRERFAERWCPEPFSGCWLWSEGSSATHRKDGGYGLVRFRGKDYQAHRVAWILYRGEIPIGLHILHSCDTPICVNPDHLRPGTPLENMAEALLKGRLKHPDARGEAHPQARLTEADVRWIRSSNLGRQEKADRLGVSLWTIKSVEQRRNWSHVSNKEPIGIGAALAHLRLALEARSPADLRDFLAEAAGIEPEPCRDYGRSSRDPSYEPEHDMELIGEADGRNFYKCRKCGFQSES